MSDTHETNGGAKPQARIRRSRASQSAAPAAREELPLLREAPDDEREADRPDPGRDPFGGPPEPGRAEAGRPERPEGIEPDRGERDRQERTPLGEPPGDDRGDGRGLEAFREGEDARDERSDRDRSDSERSDRDRPDRDRPDRDRNDRDRYGRDRGRYGRDRDFRDRDREREERYSRDRDERYGRGEERDRDRERDDRFSRDRDRGDRYGRFRDREFRDRDRDRDAAPEPREPERPALPKLYPLAGLQTMTVKELTAIAKDLDLPAVSGKKKHALVSAIMVEQVRRAGREMTEGILEILPDGYGFLRSNSYYAETGDVYVSPSQIKRLGLRTGDTILGQVRHARDGEKYAALIRIESINNDDPEKIRNRKTFEKLVPLYPDQKLNLEVIGEADISTRVMDLFCPVGKGQRGLIVAPPKAGKTTLLKQIANAITANHPEIVLMVLLIDERPEEVTDMQRSIDGEVVSSTFDEPIERHIQVSKLILEKAKRLVEMDKDVVILLDSITRLARAYNLALPSTGQTLSGGVNPAALYLPKKFFGAARNMENGGSLTIIATALVDTGSRLDDVIFEEFKGTGNLELVLDRKLFEKRIFPCIDIKKTGTRKEELLLDKDTLKKLWVLRKIVDPLSPPELMQLLIDRIGKTKTNAEFLASMHNQE